jgi:RNA polymerase sigma-70 factor, ECF subfamily
MDILYKFFNTSNTFYYSLCYSLCMAINVEEFYTQYGPMVLRRCRYILKDEDAAMDAMQDVFVQVLKKQNVLNDKAPSSLLYTIATNICLNRIRAVQSKPETQDDLILHQIASVDNIEDKTINNSFIERIFTNEKASTRTIAVLHYVDKLTLEETADFIGLSVSGVRKRLKKLREKGLNLLEAWT